MVQFTRRISDGWELQGITARQIITHGIPTGGAGIHRLLRWKQKTSFITQLKLWKYMDKHNGLKLWSRDNISARLSYQLPSSSRPLTQRRLLNRVIFISISLSLKFGLTLAWRITLIGLNGIRHTARKTAWLPKYRNRPETKWVGLFSCLLIFCNRF